MKRRHLLALGGASAISSIGGCINEGQRSDPEADDDQESDEPDEREFPDHPDTLDSDAVKEYVTEYEEVHHHNTHLNSSEYDGASCTTEIAYETEDVVYVITGCNFKRTSGSENFSYNDIVVLYAVTSDDSKRIAPTGSAVSPGGIEDRDVDTYEPTDGMTEADADYGIWVGNFDEPHDFSIELHHQTDAGQERIFEETLTSSHGKHFTRVTEVEGTYELHVELADGTALTETVEVPNDNPAPATGAYQILAAVVVTVDGELVQWDIEFPPIY